MNMMEWKDKLASPVCGLNFQQFLSDLRQGHLRSSLPKAARKASRWAAHDMAIMATVRCSSRAVATSVSVFQLPMPLSLTRPTPFQWLPVHFLSTSCLLPVHLLSTSCPLPSSSGPFVLKLCSHVPSPKSWLSGFEERCTAWFPFFCKLWEAL